MKRNTWFYALGLFVVALGAAAQTGAAKEKETTSAPKSEAATSVPGSGVEFFEAVEAGKINAKFIALNDHEAKLIVTNNTKQPLNLRLPDAFAGVPVAAQFGGGGGARGGGGGARGGGGRSSSSGGGGQQQSVGGGGGGGGIGGGGGGGGGGFFSVPPEKTEKFELDDWCPIRCESTSADGNHRRRRARYQLAEGFTRRRKCRGQGDLRPGAGKSGASAEGGHERRPTGASGLHEGRMGFQEFDPARA